MWSSSVRARRSVAAEPFPRSRRAVVVLLLAAIAGSSAAPAARAEMRFAPATVYGISGYTQKCVLADVNEDGVPDLVLANGSLDLVSVVLADGRGGFLPPITYPLGRDPYAVAVADFNGDHHLDLLVGYGVEHSVSLLLGDGRGNFSHRTDWPVAAGFTGVAAGDLNGDGIPDVVITRGTLNDTVQVSLVSAGAVLGPWQSFETSVWPMSVAMADLNRDGKLDLVTTNSGVSNLSVLLGNGAGGFAPHADYLINDAPRDAVVGDLNLDGYPDVVVPSYSHRINVFIGDGTGALRTRVIDTTGKGAAMAAAIGDVDHDGLPDVVTVSDTGKVISVLLGDGHGGFAPHQDFTAPNNCTGVLLADLDGDGFQDVIVLGHLDGTASVMLNQWRPDPPTGFAATPGPDAGEVTLSWTNPMTSPDSVRIERRAAGDGGQAYAEVAQLAGAATTCADVPRTGVACTYRAQVFRLGRVSTYSSEVTAEAYGPLAAPPLGVRAASLGDGHTLRVHVSPPGFEVTSTTSWAGVSAVEIEQASDGAFTTPVEDRVVTLPAGGQAPGEVTADVPGGTFGTPYWCRARLVYGTSDSSAWVAADSVAPRLPPVVFAHGLLGHPGDLHASWLTTLAAWGLTRVDGPAFTPPLGPWTTWAKQLRDFVTRQLDPVTGAWRGDEAVVIVAHDLGGLAARQYVEQLGGVAHVRALVMLGTPNHGATVTDFLLGPAGVLPGLTTAAQADSVRAELDPLGADLQRLNFGAPGVADVPCASLPLESAIVGRSLPVYLTVGGTAWAPCDGVPGVAKALADYCAVRVAKHGGGHGAGDFVVPWRSARLRALPDSVNLVDTQLPGGGPLAHDDRTAALARTSWALLGLPSADAVTSMLDSPAAALAVAQRLGIAPVSPPRAAAPASTAPDRMCDGCENAGSGPGSFGSYPVEMSSTAGTVSTGGTASVGATVGASDGFVVMACCGDGPLGLVLQGPGGITITPADTGGVAGVRDEADAALGYVAFDVARPAPGAWQAVVTAPGAGSARGFTLDWVAIARSIGQRVSFSPSVTGPGDTVRVQPGMGTLGSMFARVTSPSGVTSTLPWTYSGSDHATLGRYAVPPLDGRYALSLVTTGPDGPSRSIDTSFVAICRPTLGLRTTSLSWQPLLPAQDRSVLLRGVVYNTGNARADSARVWVTDGATGERIGDVVVAVAPGDSAAATIPWTPARCGLHTLTWQVESAPGQPENPSSGAAQRVVPVTGTSPTTAGAAPGLPARFALARPRPNPFRRDVAFDFELPGAASVSLAVFDVQGRLVRTLVSAALAPGHYSRAWDGTDREGTAVRSGVYFVRLATPRGFLTRRAVLIR